MIPVVFICDDNYAMPTTVAITSLLSNRYKTTQYEIIVITGGLSLNSVDNLKAAGGENLRIVTSSDKNSKYFSTQNYVSTAALFKFELPDILQEYDKVIYLDSDVIVNTDLSEMYDTDINGCYAGVVEDFYSRTDNKRIGCEVYFNSGVMLLNLKEMRDNDIPRLLYKTKETCLYNKFMDQDAFNIVFDKKVKQISPFYNYMLRNKREIGQFFVLYNLPPRQKPMIIHCTGVKPWLNKKCTYHKLWRKYYLKSPYKKHKLEADKNALIFLRQKIINNFFKLFGYKVSRMISETNRYKKLLSENGFKVDESCILIPENNIHIPYRNEADLKGIYEIFVLNKFGFSFYDTGWTVIDIGQTPFSTLYFAAKSEVSEIIVWPAGGDLTFFKDCFNENGEMCHKVNICNDITQVTNTGKILCKISAGESICELLNAVSSNIGLENIDIIIVDWIGYSSGVLKNILIKNGYKLFYRNNNKCNGEIIAVK